MSEEHFGSLKFEQIVTGERSEEEPALASHLRTCDECCERLAQYRSENARFLERHPPAALVAALEQRQSRKAPSGTAPSVRLRWSWYGAGASAAMACCAVLLVWMGGLRTDSNVPNGVRMRGSGASLQTFRVQAGELVPLSGDGLLPAETPLRFRVSTPGAHACVFHQDAAGVESLFPQGRSHATPTGPWLVPGTFALTPRGGPDDLIVVWSDEAFDCDETLEAIRQQVRGTGTIQAKVLGREAVSFRLPGARERGQGRQPQP